MLSPFWLFIAFLVTCTSADSLFTVALKGLPQTGAYLKQSHAADRARAALLQNFTNDTVPITDRVVVYTTSVGIGEPPTYHDLIVDIGTSNTFCGAGLLYTPTNTTYSTGQTMNISFPSGILTGKQYFDRVALAPNFVITNQSIGDVNSSHSLVNGANGILGLGPTALTKDTLSPGTNVTVPTVMDNLHSQGVIEKKVLGVYFAPATNFTNYTKGGALTYGGTDPSLFSGDVTYTPVTETLPAGNYWGVNITSSSYGNSTIITNSSAGVVDSGTTLILFANDFFVRYFQAIPEARLDPDTSLIRIPLSSVSLMQPLSLVIGNRSLDLDVDAQLFPHEQSVAWGGDASVRYSVISYLGRSSGFGFDFVLGTMFMERYYTIFDWDANQVGFANTNHTRST